MEKQALKRKLQSIHENSVLNILVYENQCILFTDCDDVFLDNQQHIDASVFSDEVRQLAFEFHS